jgi:hypothetical protein
LLTGRDRQAGELHLEGPSGDAPLLGALLGAFGLMPGDSLSPIRSAVPFVRLTTAASGCPSGGRREVLAPRRISGFSGRADDSGPW